MSAPRDPDIVLAAWLDDGPVDLPSSTRRAISTAVRTTPQARSGFGLSAWRPFQMSRFLTLAGAAAVVAVVIGVFAVALPRNSGGIGAPPVSSPTPSPAPSSTPAPSPTISMVGSQPFSSARYGYTLDMPAGWGPTPASRDWSFAMDRTDLASPASDHFDGNYHGNDLLLTAFSLAVPTGTVLEDWIASYMTVWTTCTVPTPAPLAIDGHPGFIVDTACDDAEAFTLVDDRVYVFSALRQSGRPLLEAVASTIKIDGVPASPGASPAAPSPSPS